MSFYHQHCESEEKAKELCDELNEKYSGSLAWFGEEQPACCEHATGGWFVVQRNEQGERWTGAPWERCWTCSLEDE